MVFCTKCGTGFTDGSGFCGTCGTPRPGAAEAPAATTVATPTDRVAQIALKKEHDKLVVQLGMFGGLISVVFVVALTVLADKMPRAVGGSFLVLIGLASAAGFIALLFPRIANSFNQRVASKRAIDPVTGKPLRMVWWFRWFTAVVALMALGGSSDYFSPSPSANAPAAVAERLPAADTTPLLSAGQRTLDARLALCVAADHEYQDVLAHKSHKDAIILANQFYVGQRAGGAAIGHEWFAYKDGEWHDDECHGLSTAPWAGDEGYAGDPIDLPAGAIGIVVASGGWTP